MLAPGEKIGGWVVERTLGEGGMGAVFLCHNAIAERIRAAVKVLKPHSIDDDRARFVREVESLDALHHPAVVRVKGWGVDATRGWLWLAMEMVDGESLEAHIARETLSEAEAVPLFSAIADGLAHAHENGIFHRDIKPANVVLDTQGRPRIVDFGIAAHEGKTRLTAQGTMPGTPAYMAPEIFTGEGPLEPGLMDIYALGQVLFEALVGHPGLEPPSEGLSTGQALTRLMVQKLDAAPLDPGPAFSPALRQAVLGATHPDPRQRTATMAALRDALAGEAPAPPETRWVRSDPEAVPAPAPARRPEPEPPRRAAPPASAPSPAPRSGRRWLLLGSAGVFAAGAVAVVLALTAGGAWWWRRGAQSEALLESAREQLTAGEPREAVRLAEEALALRESGEGLQVVGMAWEARAGFPDEDSVARLQGGPHLWRVHDHLSAAAAAYGAAQQADPSLGAEADARRVEALVATAAGTMGMVETGGAWCWPGQTAGGDGCTGAPRCPEGTVASGETCLPDGPPWAAPADAFAAGEGGAEEREALQATLREYLGLPDLSVRDVQVVGPDLPEAEIRRRVAETLGGSVVLFTAGRYVIEETLPIAGKRDVVLLGEPGAEVFVRTGRAVVAVEASERVGISGLYLNHFSRDANRHVEWWCNKMYVAEVKEADVVRITRSSSVVVRDAELQGSGFNGVYAVASRDLRVQDTAIFDCIAEAIYLEGSDLRADNLVVWDVGNSAWFPCSDQASDDCSSTEAATFEVEGEGQVTTRCCTLANAIRNEQNYPGYFGDDLYWFNRAFTIDADSALILDRSTVSIPDPLRPSSAFEVEGTLKVSRSIIDQPVLPIYRMGSRLHIEVSDTCLTSSKFPQEVSDATVRKKQEIAFVPPERGYWFDSTLTASSPCHDVGAAPRKIRNRTKPTEN